MKDIGQTTELAIAIASVIHDVTGANADGKISLLEITGIVATNAKKLITAGVGIREVPAELKDLDPQEFDELYFATLEELGLEDNNEARVKVGSVYDLLRQALITFEAWKPAAVV